MTKATLLLVVGEPFDEAQKTLILDRIIEELNGGWDDVSSGCNLQKQLDNLVASKSASNADLGAVVTHDAEDLSTTILFNPERKQLHETLQNFLLIDSNYRHLVYVGLTVAGSGSWILRDDVFTFRDFARVLKDMDSVGAGGDGKGFSLTLGLAHDWDWSRNNLSKLSSLGVKFSTENTEKRYDFNIFRDYLSHLVTVTDLKDLLKSSDTVGTINFSSPTLYIFPGGNGSSSLFGVRGFTALVDGGYGRKPCFWDFSRHIQQIDLMLLTHLSVNNILGVQSFLERKMETGLPEVGSVFFNCPEKFKKSSNASGLKMNLFQSGTTFAETLNAVGLPPQSCYSLQPTHPITLYNKVGFGSVDMYVLNPIQNTEEMRSFINQWTIRAESDCFSSGTGVPMSNSLSVSVLLVWKPFAQNGKIVRILFPGGSPQSKIFEGLDRLKNMALFERANCLQVESNDKSQNVGGKPGRATLGRTAGSKPATATKVNGEAEATKSKPDNRNPVAAKPKEPVNSKSASTSRSAKVDVKLPEKQVASAASKTNAEAKPSLGKVSSPQKTAKEVKPKPAENHLATKKPTAKPSDVELTPKAKASKLAEAGKQTKPAKRPEVLESPKMTAAKPKGEKKEEKPAAKPEAAKQTRAPEAVKQRGVVKQTKPTKDSDNISTAKQPEADKKEGQVELEKKDPEKQIEAPEEIPTKPVDEAEDKLNIESVVDKVQAVVTEAEHSDDLPSQNNVPQSLGVDSEPVVVEDVVQESETAARGSEFGIPSPEDVAQMSQEEDDSCVEELPAEVEPSCKAVIPVAVEEPRGEEERVALGDDEETGGKAVHEISEDVDVDFVNDLPAESESEPICKEETGKEQENGFEIGDEICGKVDEVLSGPNGVCNDQNDITSDVKETLQLAQHLDNGDFENNKDVESPDADGIGIKSDQQDFTDHENVQDLDHDAEEDKEEVCDQDYEVHDDRREILDHNYYHKDLPEEDINAENDDDLGTSHGLEIKTESELEKQDTMECRNEVKSDLIEEEPIGSEIKEIDDLSPSHEEPLVHDFEKGAEDDDEDDDLDAVPEEEEVEDEGGIEGDSSCQEPEFEFISVKHMTQSAVEGTFNEESIVDGNNQDFADEVEESSEVLCTLKKDEAFENLAALCFESKDVVSTSEETAIVPDLVVPCSDDVTKLWTTNTGIFDAEETAEKEEITEKLDVDPECEVESDLIEEEGIESEIKEIDDFSPSHDEPLVHDFEKGAEDDAPNPALLQSGETGDLQRPSHMVETPDDADIADEYGNLDHGDEELEMGSNSDSDEAPFNENAVKEERVEVEALAKEPEYPEPNGEDFLPQSEITVGDDDFLTSDVVPEKEANADPRILEEVKNGSFNLGFDCSENLSVENEASLKADALLKEKSGEDSGESDLDAGQESFDPYRTERFDDGREEDYRRDDGFEDEYPVDLLDLGPQQEPPMQSADFDRGLSAEDEVEARCYDVSPGSGRKNLNPFCDPDFNESDPKLGYDPFAQMTAVEKEDKENEKESASENSDADELNEFVRTELSTEAAMALMPSGENADIGRKITVYERTSEFADEDELSKSEDELSHLEQDSSQDSKPFWSSDNVPPQEIMPGRTGAADNVLFGEEANDVEKDINENLDVSNTTDGAHVEEGALTGGISSEEIHLHSSATADLVNLDAEGEVDPVKNWGQPMGLPAPTQDRTTHSRPKTRPADAANLSLPVGDRSTAATQRKATETRRSVAPKLVATSQGESKEAKESKSAANKKQFEASAAAKAKKTTSLASAETAPKSRPLKHFVPFYVDLTYIPGNGDSAFVDTDFFRRVRAKYYVLSALEPDPRVLSCLVEGKQTWENKDLAVEVIPTYDSDVLHRWRHENTKLLEDLKITVLPAANKCTIKLQADKDDGCCAFRVEF